MITLIRSYGSESALARLQSDPLFAGLAARLPGEVQCARPENAHVQIQRPSHVVFHHDDNVGASLACQIKKATTCRVICLAADIYGLDRYVRLAEFVDLFTVPTDAHRDVLGSALWVPVAVLPEGIDSIALPQPSDDPGATCESGRVCWFGYPESFQKSLFHILDRAIEESGMARDEIALITDVRREVCPDVRHLPFSPATFHRLTGGFSHALLSHFAYDLHLNTWIKSPNKLITSLVRGLTPIVSLTPSYRPLIEEFGLAEFAFRNGSELADRLRAARSEPGLGAALAPIRATLLARYSPDALARRFMELI